MCKSIFSLARLAGIFRKPSAGTAATSRRATGGADSQSAASRLVGTNGRSAFTAAIAVALLGSPLLAAEAQNPPQTKLWLETSLHRVFPSSPPGSKKELTLLSARNQQV